MLKLFPTIKSFGAGREDFDDQILGVSLAGSPFQTVPQFPAQVADDDIVIRGSTRHREHFPIVKLTAELRRALDFEILGSGQLAFREDDHARDDSPSGSHLKHRA